jgi:hypothetical protein
MTSILAVWIDSLLVKNTFLWLLSGHLKGETESEIKAAPDQALHDKYHATEILHTETDRK